MKPLSIYNSIARRARLLFTALIGIGVLEVSIHGQNIEDYEKAPILYSQTAPSDAIARLERELAGQTSAFTGTDREVLEQLLARLDVPVSSQMLVFSKTSLQRRAIHPSQPRAVYFSDDCYIGWVPGGLIEVASMDPYLGPVFYTLDPRQARETDKDITARRGGLFQRDADCLSCHGGSFVRGIPSVFARSVFPDKNGEMLLRHGSQVVDFRTPFEDRWGGWYVTGQHGNTTHRGNNFAREREKEAILEFDPKVGANLAALDNHFSTDRYPRPDSDIVALLVFEHQIAMHNALTRAAHQSRRMLHYQAELQRAFGDPITETPTFDSVRRVFTNSVEDVVDHLLFKDEAALPESIVGNQVFSADFDRRSVRDASGASLRDLHLRGRLFENRCSYLIYSHSFQSLPETLRRSILIRLAQALNPSTTETRHTHLEFEERLRIAAILKETHPDFQSGGIASNLLLQD